jgi:hypothetical protein
MKIVPLSENKNIEKRVAITLRLQKNIYQLVLKFLYLKIMLHLGFIDENINLKELIF